MLASAVVEPATQQEVSDYTAFTGPQLALESLFQGEIDARGLPSCLPASIALLSPALMRWRIMLRSNLPNAPRRAG
jgi:hypothetical protein